MPNDLAVRLYASDNKHLRYPCEGLLELFELGTNGSVIVGVWRGFKDGKPNGGPVEVKNPIFLYTGLLSFRRPG